MSDQRVDKWDLRFLHLAEHIAQWSKDPSTKCGAVIVADDRSVVSMGYNGFPRGMDDDPALYADREVKYERTVHCEMNAVLSAHLPVNGCTLYTWPFLSCPRCAMHMIQAGIIRCVAPRLPEDKVERWGEALERSRAYFQEAGVAFTEVDLARGTVHREYKGMMCGR